MLVKSDLASTRIEDIIKEDRKHNRGKVYYESAFSIAYSYSEQVSCHPLHVMENVIAFYADMILNKCGLCENRRAR